MVDRYDLPRPEVNTIVHGYEVDMLWRPQRLIAELDGRQHELAFEATANATPTCWPTA